LRLQVPPYNDHSGRSEVQQLHEGDQVWEENVERSCEPLNKIRKNGKTNS